MLTNVFFVFLTGLVISAVLAIICFLLIEYTNIGFFEIPTMLFTGLSVILFVLTAIVGIMILIQFFIVGIVNGIVTLL